MWWTNLERVWRRWFVPSANESEESVEEELMFHLRSLIDENLANGMPTDAAWLEAQTRFGSLRRYADECRGVLHRGQAMLQKLSAVGLLLVCALVGWVAIDLRGLRGEQRLARAQAEQRFDAWEQRDQQERYAHRLASNEEAAAERGDVQGVVVDRYGEPLADAHVLVALKTWPDGLYREEDFATTSDSEGRFRLAKLLPTAGHREILVAAVKHGHALTSTYQAMSAGEPLAVEPVVLKLEDGADLTVVVRDRAGRPAAHARVVPAFRRTAAGEEHLVYLRASAPIRTVSDDDGRAALGCFQPGDEAEVWIQVPGGDWERRAITIPGDSEVITLSSGELSQETDGQSYGTNETTLNQPVLPAAEEATRERKDEPTEEASFEPCDLRGVVVDRNGEPLADAKVEVILKTWPGGRYRQQEFITTSDAEGQFCLKKLIPTDGQRAVHLAAAKDGYACASVYESNRAGEPLGGDPIELKLEDAMEITLTVQDQLGRPVGHAQVLPKSRRTSSGDEYEVYRPGSVWTQGLSGDDGKVHFSCLPRGDYVEFLVGPPGNGGQVYATTIEGDSAVIVVSAAEADGDVAGASDVPAADTPQKFDPAEVEMHVIGVTANDMERLDVKIRPTAKPIVLVLTSYYSVDWHINVTPDARIKRVIVSGYLEQRIQGLPPDVPVVNQSYFPNDGSRRQQGWVYPAHWNTPQWREMVRRLNEMTGLPVTSYQEQHKGASAVVDGNVGRDQGQNELRSRARGPNQPTPQELLAASANSELHVIGIYSGMLAPGMTSPGKPLDVEVRSTTKPVVLVLTSYMETVWNAKRAEGARINAVIVGGARPQEVEGIPDGVPVYYACPDGSSHYFDRMKLEQEESSFAYRPNTLEYRRIVERLNDLTGLLVSTFQGEDSGTPFVVDGKRGEDFAQKARKPRPTLPKEPTPGKLLAASADANLHVVSIYGTAGGNGAPVDVEVRPTDKRIVLALASYNSVLWNVKIAPGARVKAVIIGGYCEQEFDGIPANIPIACRAYLPSQNADYFYAYEWNTIESRGMVEKLNALTGLLVSTFQVEQSGSSFVVDGRRGDSFAQKERKPRPGRNR